MNLYFYPDDSKILETWNQNSSFKYFRFSVCFLGEVTARQFCFEIYWPLYTHSEQLQVVRFRTRCIPSDKRGSFLECERCQFQFFISFGKPRPSSFFPSIHLVDIHIGSYLIQPKVWQKMSKELWLQLNEYKTDLYFLQTNQN